MILVSETMEPKSPSNSHHLVILTAPSTFSFSAFSLIYFSPSLPAPLQPLSLILYSQLFNSLYFYRLRPSHYSSTLLVTTLTSYPPGSSKDPGSGMMTQQPNLNAATSISRVLPSLIASLFLSLYQLCYDS